ncbi:hypothetical protein CVT25_012869 [Psilocybe cyanescens]|uniref:Uncharacterized protein n=1 Tax=Psilocybe cyanescens TaxID=93625 RepID=A0A409XLU7_PSICY|nr:hypothetical protein CVT25_012869 [Psilocybe cyanescens]
MALRDALCNTLNQYWPRYCGMIADAQFDFELDGRENEGVDKNTEWVFIEKILEYFSAERLNFGKIGNA